MKVNVEQNAVVNLVPLLNPQDNDLITVEFDMGSAGCVYIGWSNGTLSDVEDVKQSAKRVVPDSQLARRSVRYKTGMNIYLTNTSVNACNMLCIIDNGVDDYF
ncbi:TPA: hypothetical protein ACGU4W_001109 [Vibrio vulnificus]|nr:hypothetical protein [Vibrio vulnificus]